MNKTLIFVSLLVMLCLLLSACGPASAGVQLPGLSDGSGEGSQEVQNNALIYVLIGAVVLVAVVALLRKK